MANESFLALFDIYNLSKSLVYDLSDEFADTFQC